MVLSLVNNRRFRAKTKSAFLVLGLWVGVAMPIFADTSLLRSIIMT